MTKKIRRHRVKNMFSIMVLVAVLGGTGCIQVEQDLVLHTDGSGELRILYGVKERDLQRMREVTRRMAAIDPSFSSSDADWLNSFDEDRIRREWDREHMEGVELVDVKTGLQEPWRILRARIRFQTLQHLLDAGVIQQCHIALARGDHGQYGYQQTLDLGGTLKNLPPGMDLATIQPLAALMLADLRATLHVQAPGSILRSNADRVEGRRATWEIKGTDEGSLERLQDLDMRLLFDGRALKIADARARL